MTDVVIPLGTGSRNGNEELRLLLRSLEAHAEDLGEVYLVTDRAPEWVRGVTVVPVGDVYPDCKDANLFRKTHEAIRRYHLGRFCWAADDNVLLRRMRLADIPVIHNHRDNAIFYSLDATPWQMRVRDTLEWAKARGVPLEHNYECHCLQCFDGQAILRGMEGVSYYPAAKTIYTTWRVVTDTWRGSVDQRQWKETYQMPQDPIFEKPLLGYNDAGFPSIRDALFRMFRQKSRFEKSMHEKRCEKMKIAIVTNAIYRPVPQYVRITDARKSKYCDKWGIDYVRRADNPHPDLHPVWCKPRVLLDEMEGRDWLVWMDCDAMPTNMDFDLAGYLAGVGERVVMLRDINGWNNGIFAMPCTENGRRWLEHIDSLSHDPRYQRGYREQQAMADSFAAEWAWIVEEPPERIGWNDYLPELYHREGDRNVWCEKSWVLHLPAVSSDRRAAIFREAAAR